MPGKIAFDRVEEHPSAGVETIKGDRATYTTKANWHYTNTKPDRRPGEWMWWGSDYQDWTFHLVNDDGWRICEVNAPNPAPQRHREPARDRMGRVPATPLRSALRAHLERHGPLP